MPVSRRTGTFVLFSFFFCLFSVPAQAIDFINDETFIYDIRENSGELGDGSWNNDALDDACDGCWELRIDGNTYGPGGSLTLDASGREATFPVQDMSGLQVVRRVYVPQEVNFVRYLNVLTNPTGADITVQVAYDTNLGSDSSTIIVSSSSGDNLASTDDFWLVTNGDPNDPVVVHLWDGIGAIDRIDSLFVSAPGDDDVDWSWENVTVPAGETVIYMTLGVMTVSGEDGVNAANALFNLQLAQLTFNLNEATEQQIRNWSFTDSDEDGMPDGYENFYGLDPNNASDAASDNDMDGLTAIEEFNALTDPTNPDTDNDGLLDGDEVNTYATNPINDDTDGDDVSDGGEVNSGLDPNDPNDVALLKLVSDGVNRSLTPEGYEDDAGNVHIVYSAEVAPSNGGPAGTARGGSFRQVFYTLLAGNGDVLIAPTQISVEGMGDDFNIRPQVAAHSSGTVYIVWQERCCSEQLYVKVLDVSADDQDGSAADLVEIGPIPERLLSLDGVNHAAVEIDSAGNGHIAAAQRCGNTIRYYKVGPDSFDIFPEVIVANYGACHATVDLGIDSAGNVHIVYSSDEDLAGTPLSWYQLFYGMLDGTDGSTLIEPTLLSPDDGQRVKHTTITVDDADLAHIVFGMGVPSPIRGGSSNPAEVFYTVVDPSLDDQNGDAASAAAITVTPITMISADDGQLSWYVESRRLGDEIGITWNDGGGNGSAPVYYISLAIDDGSTTEPLLVSDTAARITNNNYVPVPGGKALLKENRDGVVSIFAKTLFAGPVETATGTGIAEVDADGGVAVWLEALNVADLPAEAQAMAPVAIDFPDGLFRVIINGVPVGGSVDMTLELPTEYELGSDFLFKWNLVEGWTSYPYALGATPMEIVYTLTDGGAGDADGVANGQIVDPVGPAKNGNANAPQFTSAPPASVTVGEAYSYTVTASDVETGGSSLTYMGLTVPAWLTLVDNGDGTATLSGTPAEGDVGANDVSLQVDDGAFVPQQATQNFTITVNTAVEPTVTTNVSGDGGGNGATTPWLLLLAAGLLFMRSRRSQKGAQ